MILNINITRGSLVIGRAGGLLSIHGIHGTEQPDFPIERSMASCVRMRLEKKNSSNQSIPLKKEIGLSRDVVYPNIGWYTGARQKFSALRSQMSNSKVNTPIPCSVRRT